MMKYKGVSIVGLDRFISDIGKAKDHLKSGGMFSAMVKSVNLVKNNTQPITPYRTGTLRRSLWTNVTNNGMRGEVNQDSNMAPYGIYVEMGTKRMKPRYFMAQGLERSISAVEKIFSDLLGQVVKIMAD